MNSVFPFCTISSHAVIIIIIGHFVILSSDLVLPWWHSKAKKQISLFNMDIHMVEQKPLPKSTHIKAAYSSRTLPIQIICIFKYYEKCFRCSNGSHLVSIFHRPFLFAHSFYWNHRVLYHRQSKHRWQHCVCVVCVRIS